MLEDLKSALIEIELLSRNVKIPIDHLHEKSLQLIDVGEGHTADLGDELVRVVSVIEHLGRDQDGSQNQPKTSKKEVSWLGKRSGD